MSAVEHKTLIRRFVEEAFNRGNLDVVDEVYAPDYVGHTAGDPEGVRGPEGVKQFVGLYRGAFPTSTLPSRTWSPKGRRWLTAGRLVVPTEESPWASPLRATK